MSAHQDIGQVVSGGPNAKTMKFGADLGLYQHSLHQNPLFSDASLLKLLDTYPREKIDVYTVRADQKTIDKNRRGAAGELTGAQLLDAVKKGRIQLELRCVNKYLEPYQQIADKMFADLHQMHPGLATFSHDVGVVIASPGLQQFYQFDTPLTAYFQVRGETSLRVWDAIDPYVGAEQLESQALTELSPVMEFNPIWNEDAQSAALKPGMMATWAQNSPYRLTGNDALNVMVSAAFFTPAAFIRANAVYGNAVIRKKFGLAQKLLRFPTPFSPLKVAVASIAKRLGWYPSMLRARPVTFRVEPAAPNAVRELSQVAA
jgi:hypothetical protein